MWYKSFILYGAMSGIVSQNDSDCEGLNMHSLLNEVVGTSYLK
jgi:hypothetical protein